MLPGSDNHRLRAIDLSADVQTTRAVAFDADVLEEAKNPTASHPASDRVRFRGLNSICIARGSQFTSSPADTLYVTTEHAIFQFNANTKALAPIQFTLTPVEASAGRSDPPLRYIPAPSGIACMSNGVILLTCEETGLVFAIDAQKQSAIRIAGAYPRDSSLTELDRYPFEADLSIPFSLLLDDDESMCWITAFGPSTLKRLTLPDSFTFDTPLIKNSSTGTGSNVQ